MFKAKLIENENYYKSRSKFWLLFILPSIPLGYLITFHDLSLGLTLLAIALYLALWVILIRNQRKMMNLLGNRQIELNDKEVRISAKDGAAKEVFKLEEVNKVIMNEEYAIPNDGILGKKNQIKKNCLILEKDNKQTKFDFEIESQYMIKQLNDLFNRWKEQGYNVVRANNS